MTVKTHYSAQELAGLPGMPGTERAIQLRGKRDWKGQKRQGTKAIEYALASLPAETQAALIKAAIDQAPAVQVVKAETLPVVAGAATELAGRQRDCAEARLAFVREVQRLAPAIGKERAVMEMVAAAAAATLPEHLQQLVKVANAKAGEDRSLSRRRIFEWCTLTERAEVAGSSAVAALAPKARARAAVPAWAAPLLKAYADPQKPPLTDVLETLRAKLGKDTPSYHQARRFLAERMGNVDVQRGRMGPREIKNIQPFVRRDTSMLLPTQVYTADGHCFDAEVQHPKHGRAFRPEITAVLDVATRKAVGWSCDLAESRWAVIDALRMASCSAGIAAIFYVDNGSGYVNDLLQAEGVGLMARLGTDMKHSLAYNSQARGIIERSHQSIWIKAAKKLPTYMGADMDRQARQGVHKLTRQDIARVGTSRVLMTWPDFVAFVKAEAEDYNNRPHRALPKLRDPVTLKQRHMTPNEAWAAHVEQGFEAVLPTETEADDLFRPYTVVNVRRGEIQLHGNRYFSKRLEQYHGEAMSAGYDIRDPQYLWVRDLDGHFIARAELNANSKPYYASSVIEQAEETREKGRLRRLQRQIDEVHLERKPNLVLAHMESSLNINADLLARRSAEVAALPVGGNVEPFTPRSVMEQPPVQAVSPEQKYQRWQALDLRVGRGEELSEADRNFWELFPQSHLYQLMQERYRNRAV